MTRWWLQHPSTWYSCHSMSSVKVFYKIWMDENYAFWVSELVLQIHFISMFTLTFLLRVLAVTRGEFGLVTVRFLHSQTPPFYWRIRPVSTPYSRISLQNAEFLKVKKKKNPPKPLLCFVFYRLFWCRWTQVKHSQSQLKMDTFSVSKVKERLKYWIQIFWCCTYHRITASSCFCNAMCVFLCSTR